VYAAKKAGRNKVCVAAEPASAAPAGPVTTAAPVAPPVVSVAPARRFDDNPAAPSDKKRVVLVVEDDALSAKMLEVLLTRHGQLRVMVTGSAEDALKLLHGTKKEPKVLPDLVLVDIGLPAMSGIEFVRSCKGSPALSAISMATMSANTTDRERVDARAAGAIASFDKAQLCADVMGSIKKITDLMPPQAFHAQAA
jgi:CheY-like chemotaxis protein